MVSGVVLGTNRFGYGLRMIGIGYKTALRILGLNINYKLYENKQTGSYYKSKVTSPGILIIQK